MTEKEQEKLYLEGWSDCIAAFQIIKVDDSARKIIDAAIEKVEAGDWSPDELDAKITENEGQLDEGQS